MTYVFDTSSLIGAWVRAYPPDAFPVVWDHMDGLATSGNLLVPEEVYEELSAQDDDLLEWVKERSGLIVIPTTRAVPIQPSSPASRSRFPNAQEVYCVP